jgi:tetrahydromethanopterin S-methyltransferase subunit G
MSEAEHKVVTEQIKGLTTLINSQFRNVEDNFQAVHQRLDKINGKVGKHDEQINEALIERAKNREEQRNMIPTHVMNCPNLQEIRGCRIKIENVETKMEKLQGQLEDAFFFIRHPKLFIATLVIIVLLTLGTFISNNPLKAIGNLIHPVPTEQIK